MTTAASDTLPGHPVAAAPMAARHGRAMLALARVEAIHLVRHPLTVVAALLLVAPWVYGWVRHDTASRYPILSNADRATQVGAFFLLGSAALLAGNLATVRSHRHGAQEQFAVLLLPAWRRCAALLLAVVPLSVLTAVLVGVRAAILAATPGAVGHLSPAELATGPVAVLMMGVLGVALGTAIRSVVVALLTLVGLAAALLFAAMPILLGASRGRWLLPIAFADPTEPTLPSGLLGRPAGSHVVYLVGVIALVVVLALARAGASRWPVAIVALASLLLTGVAGADQLAPASATLRANRLAATEHPAKQQICQRRGQLTYCAFPEFAPWINAWDQVVRGVLRRVPSAAQRPVSVRQRVFAFGHPQGGSGMVPPAPLAQWQADDRGAGTPDAVTVGTDWGGQAEVELATGVATLLVAGAPSGDVSSGGAIAPVCGARGVLVLWLVGQVDPSAAGWLRDRAANGSGGIVITPAGFGTGWSFDRAQARLALSALDQPVDRITSSVVDSWPRLTSTDVSLQQAASMLGLPDPGQQSIDDDRC